MRRLPFLRSLVLVALVFAACGEKPSPDPVDPCAALKCGPGESCDADGRVCKCGGEVCGPGRVCEASLGRCVADCAAVSCERGMSCDPSDGACRCGEESCESGWRCNAQLARCEQDLPDRCAAGTGWTAGTRAFREATEALGLIGVAGVRLSVGDFDGDGWADLSVRRGGLAADDFTEGGPRATWLLRNDQGARFVDVTESSGFVATRRGEDPKLGRPAEVVVWADVDNDGDLDAFTGMSYADPANPQVESSEIMLNRGDGTFELGPEASAVRREGERVERAGAAFVDFDRDGTVDLWIGNSAVKGANPSQDQLYRGLGGGLFEDVTVARGLQTRGWSSVSALNAALAHSYAWSVAACDLNGDGGPELLAASYGRAPNHLWQAGYDAENQVAFVNRSIDSGYAFDERTDWTDNESARCWCQWHREDPGCAQVPEPQLIRCTSDQDAFRWNHANDRQPFRLGGNSGTTVCADVNNDGALDLLTTEIVHWDVGSSSDPSELLLNTGEPNVRFTRPGNENTGLARDHDRIDWNDGDITAAVFDFDNDARPDLYIGSTDYPGTRGHLYWQRADGTFEPVAFELGIDHLASHGIAVADFDRDGDLDLVVGHSRARCEDQCYPTANVRYFENLLGQDGNWIQLSLSGGDGTNRAAIGARVTVSAGGVTQTQEVGGGHGHYGIQHDLTLHFGLGSACEAQVKIRWPDKALSTQELTLRSGYRYRVVQGEPALAVLD